MTVKVLSNVRFLFYWCPSVKANTIPSKNKCPCKLQVYYNLPGVPQHTLFFFLLVWGSIFTLLSSRFKLHTPTHPPWFIFGWRPTWSWLRRGRWEISSGDQEGTGCGRVQSACSAGKPRLPWPTLPSCVPPGRWLLQKFRKPGWRARGLENRLQPQQWWWPPFSRPQAHVEFAGCCLTSH